MNLLSKLKKTFLIGAGVTLFSLLPLDVKAEGSSEKPKNYSFSIGASVQKQHSAGFDENFNMFGIYSGARKRLIDEIYGSVIAIESWDKNEELEMKAQISEIAPHLEWHPLFGGEEWLYLGAGFKYKSITFKDLEGNSIDSADGVGFSILFGSNIYLGKEGFFLNFETGYDKVKGEYEGYELDLGATRFTIGFGRGF